MKVRNVLTRIHDQRLLFAAALFGLSLTANAAGYGIDRARGNAIWDAAVNGRSTTLGLAGKRMETYTPVAPRGNADGSVTVGGRGGKLPVGESLVPVDVGGKISKEDIIGAVAGCATGGVVGCVLGTLTPLAIGYMLSSGTRIGPDGQPQINGDDYRSCANGTCYEYATQNFDASYWGTPTGACKVDVLARNALATDGYKWTQKRIVFNGVEASCELSYHNKDGDLMFERFSDLQKRVRLGDSGTWNPATSQEIKDSLYNNNPPPAIVDELAKHGNIVWPLGDPTITGPSSITGPKETTTNPDGSTSTRETKTPITYDGGTATAGNPTTTTTKRNTDGSDGGTTTTTTEPGNEPSKDEEPPKDPCDEHPERVGCLDIDVPEGDIPRENKTVTWTPEDPFGSGSCPVDQTLNLTTTNQTVKVTNWVQMCEWSIPLRAIILALATFAAFLIVMPGETRV